MQSRALLTTMLLLSGIALGAQAIAQQKVAPIVGTYILIQDDDGTAPRADAQVTLVFLPDGTAVLSASLPGTPVITDKGGWSMTSDGKLTLVLPESGKAFSQSKITASGRDLTIPIHVFSDTDGSSNWKRSSTMSLKAFAKAPVTAAIPTVIAPVVTNPIPVVTNPTPVVTNPVGPGKKPDPIPTPVVTNPTPVVNPTPTPVVTNPPVATIPAYVGRYQGTAIGAEVRYRKDGVFTLTAKHTANFSFDINEKGEVKGIGEISYALDSDRKGTGVDAAEVENFPATYTPGGKLTLHDSSLQGGTVNKTVELKGTFDPKTNALTLILVTAVGDLIYEYDSNGQKAQKPFPAWSPFPPDVPAILEMDGQGNASAAVDLAGNGRRDKWQEYRFVWKASKIK
jgi:hypothetical protein